MDTDTDARAGRVNPAEMEETMKINMREEMDFLNSSNEFNCDHCYYNRDYDDFQHRLPCGQWNCWVTICCDRAEALDDEE